MNQQAAFTLIELAIYLAIFSVLCALSLPSMFSFMEKQRGKQAAIAFHNFIQLARQNALLTGKTLSICATSNGIQCSNSKLWSDNDILLFIDENKNGQVTTPKNIIKVFALKPHQGTLEWRSFGNKPYLQWQNNGTTYYQNGSFLFCPNSKNSRHGFLLTVNTLGRAYLAKDKDKDGIVEDSSGNNIRCS